MFPFLSACIRPERRCPGRSPHAARQMGLRSLTVCLRFFVQTLNCRHWSLRGRPRGGRGRGRSLSPGAGCCGKVCFRCRGSREGWKGQASIHPRMRERDEEWQQSRCDAQIKNNETLRCARNECIKQRGIITKEPEAMFRPARCARAALTSYFMRLHSDPKRGGSIDGLILGDLLAVNNVSRRPDVLDIRFRSGSACR